jgi:hypothetical protein
MSGIATCVARAGASDDIVRFGGGTFACSHWESFEVEQGKRLSKAHRRARGGKGFNGETGAVP